MALVAIIALEAEVSMMKSVNYRFRAGEEYVKGNRAIYIINKKKMRESYFQGIMERRVRLLSSPHGGHELREPHSSKGRESV